MTWRFQKKKIRVRLNARADDLLEYTLLSLIFARLPLEIREFGIEIFLAGLKCRDFDESSFFKVIKFANQVHWCLFLKLLILHFI